MKYSRILYHFLSVSWSVYCILRSNGRERWMWCALRLFLGLRKVLWATTIDLSWLKWIGGHLSASTIDRVWPWHWTQVGRWMVIVLDVALASHQLRCVCVCDSPPWLCINALRCGDKIPGMAWLRTCCVLQGVRLVEYSNTNVEGAAVVIWATIFVPLHW